MVVVAGFWFWSKFNHCDAVTIRFANEDWTFPSTIGEAVNNHDLDFKPPGYYYKTDSINQQILLAYHDEFGDYDDDRQAKETLYPRDVHTYVFQFKKRPNTYDSLKRHFETQFKQKFVLTKGIKTRSFWFDYGKMPFEHHLLKVDDCLTIGIKNSKSDGLGEIVTVQLLYGLPLGDIGIWMGNW